MTVNGSVSLLYPIQRDQKVLPLSVVIPTRARCPESGQRMGFNPLSQCLDSILFQCSLPQQIIIASAHTGDYTSEILDHYRHAFLAKDVELTTLWFPNEDNIGPFGKIARALQAIKYDFVHLVEDDVFLYQDAIRGGYQLRQNLLTRHPKISVINLPIYRRATFPTKLVSYSEIGRLDDSLRLTGCFESVFPQELSHDPTGSTYSRVEGFLGHWIDFFRGGNEVIMLSLVRPSKSCQTRVWERRMDGRSVPDFT